MSKKSKTKISEEDIVATLHLSGREAARVLGVNESSVRHRRKAHRLTTRTETVDKISDRIVTLDDARELIRKSGDDPEKYDIQLKTGTYGSAESPQFTNQILLKEKKNDPSVDGPAWPVVQPATPVVATPPKQAPALIHDWKTAVIFADTQFGFRHVDDEYIPFHDDAAIDTAWAIVGAINPHVTVGAGDIIDLPSQSRWAQEASFANTTQKSLDECHHRMAQLRSQTSGEIVLIEGNHDKRMQNFVETNALSAFGLKKAGLPESWPVMSMPNLLRLDELDIQYQDAYPAAHYWINDKLKVEHGTKANANGSTMQRYLKDEPHFSRAAGHSHRLELNTRTTYDRMGRIQSFGINPGCLCRVDGAVPSFNGAVGADGRHAEVFEDWQNGIAVVKYTDEEIYPIVVPINDGRAYFEGQWFGPGVEGA